MVHLASFLPANGQRLKQPPNTSRSKTHGRQVRGRNEALSFYASFKNRHCDFAPQHFQRMREICPGLLRALGYDDVLSTELTQTPLQKGLCSWVPELRSGDILAVRFRSDSARASG